LDLQRKDKLLKLKFKNRGNVKLLKAVDSLIDDIENAKWKTKSDINKDRPDSDCIHSDGFYFFDISIFRAMILIVFEENEATIIWTGSHHEYELTFKGNKKTIEVWLRKNGLIK
jgi:mRNA-degrading endonuclease HigB of HigAB toxin-antitoxin module